MKRKWDKALRSCVPGAATPRTPPPSAARLADLDLCTRIGVQGAQIELRQPCAATPGRPRGRSTTMRKKVPEAHGSAGAGDGPPAGAHAHRSPARTHRARPCRTRASARRPRRLCSCASRSPETRTHCLTRVRARDVAGGRRPLPSDRCSMPARWRGSARPCSRAAEVGLRPPGPTRCPRGCIARAVPGADRVAGVCRPRVKSPRGPYASVG